MEGKNVMCKLAKEKQKKKKKLAKQFFSDRKKEQRQKARAKIEFDCIHL